VGSTHSLTRRPRRRPTTLDHVRTREFLARLDRGEDEVTAFWEVASHPGYGFARYRGVSERPDEIVLRRKMASLLARTVPHLLGTARDLALGRLAALSDDAVTAVKETLTGEVEDGRMARARLDAAKTVLGSLGIGERAAPFVATQVNLDVQPVHHAGSGLLKRLDTDPA
jgi:hypothetical protein